MKATVCLLALLAVSGEAQWSRPAEGGASQAQTGPAREWLEAHNAVRRLVGVPELAWSSRLATTAQDWARTLIARRQFKHSPGAAYGENLYEISGAAASPASVVRAWASEARDYDHRSNSCRGGCGHYTQLVWARTKEVGCGVARERGREVWVCHYDPPGNIVGRRPY